MLIEAQNALGGLPDLLMRDGLLFDGKRNRLTRDVYLSRLAYYERYLTRRPSVPGPLAGHAVAPPAPPFFDPSPTQAPAHRVLETRAYESGTEQLLTYPSRYEPKHPALEAELAAYAENRDCYALLWRHHPERVRPLVLCVHGFQMGTPERAMRLFKVGKLFSLGLDVGLFCLPHHWRRTRRPSAVREQHFLNPHDVPLTLETLGQTTHDLRSLTLLLSELGFEKQALIGASLGGCALALYALVDDSPDCLFCVVPALRFDQTLQPRARKLGFPIDDEVRRLTTRALEVVAPVSYTPKLDVEKLGVVYHQGDRLTEAKYVREWLARWGVENVTSVPGGHWAVFDRKARGRAWYGWLERHGFLDPATRPYRSRGEPRHGN